MEIVKIHIRFVCKISRNPSGEMYAMTREICMELLTPNNLLESANLVAKKIVGQCLHQGDFVIDGYSLTIAPTANCSYFADHGDLTSNLTKLLFPEENSPIYDKGVRSADFAKQRMALLDGFGIGENGLLADMGVRVWVYHSAPCGGI